MISEPSTPNPPRNQTLEDAWQRFGKYDKNAGLAQKRFVFQRKLILILGVAATAIAVTYSELEKYIQTAPTWIPANINQQQVMDIFHALVVIVPIVATALAAYSVKFPMGVNWVMLRSSAEALKKEIYRYRMRVDEYNLVATSTESRDVELARKVKLTSKRLMETQVNQTGLHPYDGDLPPKYGTAEKDDGFSDLTPDQYILHRVEDQFNYYQKKAVRLGKELHLFQILILSLGGISALLAALKFEIWIAISGALATAFVSFLEFKRVESNIVSCNMAASDLYDIRAWWRALSDAAKAQQSNIETLVSSTESVIQTENTGWVQEMRDALSEIYGDKKKAEEARDIQPIGEGQEGQQLPDQAGTSLDLQPNQDNSLLEPSQESQLLSEPETSLPAEEVPPPLPDALQPDQPLPEPETSLPAEEIPDAQQPAEPVPQGSAV